jgi:hypothetical protein
LTERTCDKTLAGIDPAAQGLVVDAELSADLTQ